MNSFTNKKHYAAGLIILTIALFPVFTGCSSFRDDDFSKDQISNDKGLHTMVFHDDNVEWKVKMKDDKIVSLYKDGEKIPDNKLYKYKDYIYDKIDEINEDMKEFSFNMKDFHVDMENFNRDMEKMREELNRQHVDINFDHEQFGKEMENAADEIRKAFDSDEFRNNMKNLQEELKNIKVDVDAGKIHEEMDNVREQLKNIKVDINMDDFHNNMMKMKKELKDMKSDLKDAKKGARKFKMFLYDLKEGLQKDGLIDESDDNFDLQFNSKELIINGKKAPDDIHNKYKKMYEERFNRTMDDDMSIIF